MAKIWHIVFLTLFCSIFYSCSKEEDNHFSSLQISTEEDPQTLDPRLVRDLSTTTVIHMLYEGLLRDLNGELIPAIADRMTMSSDRMTYTFHLRRSAWSDGLPVTAHDFEQTWKSILDPKFPSPNAYQLYTIRGAKAAKEGKVSSDQIGVHAKDDTTLIVELETPTPYFPQLLATHFFYPVHPTLYTPTYRDNSNIHFPTNGPYCLKNWKHHDELNAIPNPHYWDKKNVHLNQISFLIVDNMTALHLFNNGTLDWVGSPMSTLSTDSLAYLKQKGELHILPGAGVYLFRINTDSFPFHHRKMRQAFGLALNRYNLVEHVLQGNQEAACGIIPSTFIKAEPFFQDNDTAKARQLFREALEELNLSAKDLSNITIYYANGERGHKIAQVAQQQWKECFGIDIKLLCNESKVYFDCLKNHDYQIGVGSWFSDFRDPISFLDIFKFKENGTNNTQWENQEFIALLDQSNKLPLSLEREKLLKEAEKILLEDMPIIPLFYSTYNFMKKDSVGGVYFSDLGYLDFKNAYFIKN